MRARAMARAQMARTAPPRTAAAVVAAVASCALCAALPAAKAAAAATAANGGHPRGGVVGVGDAVGTATQVTLSNTRLPTDQHGQPLVTGEAGCVEHNGTFYFYFNDWGTCPGVDCCASSEGCGGCCQVRDPPHPLQPGCVDPNNGSNPYGLYHRIVAYSTRDWSTWTNLGVALPLSARAPGQLMRPHVLVNKPTGKFVLWYEDRPEHGYSVAVSGTPGGPFTTVRTNVTMPGKGRIGDMDLFVDDDGTAYQVRTSFTIVKLSSDYLDAVTLVAEVRPPKPSEAPVLFKRGGAYYLGVGVDCCYCMGGSNIMVMKAGSLAGPWAYVGDIGSNASQKFDLHSRFNYVTWAQQQKVIPVPGPDGPTFLWMGMQWNSGLLQTPRGPRNHDLIAWYVLDFDAEGNPKQLTHSDAATFPYVVPPASS